MYIRIVQAILLLSILSACSQAADPRQLSVDPELTVLPASPAAASDQPAADPPTSGPTKSIGTPVPGWEDIPILPGAYDAELNDLVYLYSVKVPVEEAEEYYLVKMDVNGWTLSDRQVMDISGSSEPATILDFEKDDQSLNVMLVELAEENATTVILSLFGP